MYNILLLILILVAFLFIFRKLPSAVGLNFPKWQGKEFWPQTLAIFAFIKLIITVEITSPSALGPLAPYRSYIWAALIFIIFIGLAGTAREAHFTRSVIAGAGILALLVDISISLGWQSAGIVFVAALVIIISFWILAPFIRMVTRFLRF